MKSVFLIISILILLSVTSTFAQVDFIWGKQLGTEQDDKTRNIITDPSGNIYVLGKTLGKIGNESFGKSDGFVVKIDSSANLIWSFQIGSKEDDDLKHAAVDSLGNIYLTGVIGSDDPHKSTDLNVLILKLNQNGEIVWKKNIGSDDPDEGGNIVVCDDGSIYVTGFTNGNLAGTSNGQSDCFILHLDSNGNQMNAVQFGTSEIDQCFGITIGDDSNIYVCGNTNGNMAAPNAGNADLFWGKFTKDLKQLKMAQTGTSLNDYAGDIKTDHDGNVYVAGSTDGDLGALQIGSSDAFIQKWDKKGKIVWTKQFGTRNWDGIHSICIIQNKGILVSGCMDYPKCKSFCKMYNESGTELWHRSFIAQGKGGGTCGKDICLDNKGYLYHAGYTGANLFSELIGMHDLFLIKLKIDL